MMPEACASMRSMARWVLPVFVGPRTALTRGAKPESKPGMGKMVGCCGAECKRFRRRRQFPRARPSRRRSPLLHSSPGRFPSDKRKARRMRSTTERRLRRDLRTASTIAAMLIVAGNTSQAWADQVTDQETLLAPFNDLLNTPAGQAVLTANLQTINAIYLNSTQAQKIASGTVLIPQDIPANLLLRAFPAIRISSTTRPACRRRRTPPPRSTPRWPTSSATPNWTR